jgi:type II secretory pathway pseudopilin PulG
MRSQSFDVFKLLVYMILGLLALIAGISLLRRSPWTAELQEAQEAYNLTYHH